MAKKRTDKRVTPRTKATASTRQTRTVSADGNTITDGDITYKRADVEWFKGFSRVKVYDSGKKVDEYIVKKHTGEKGMLYGYDFLSLDEKDTIYEWGSAKTSGAKTKTSSSTKTTRTGTTGVSRTVTKDSSGTKTHYTARVGKHEEKFQSEGEAAAWRDYMMSQEKDFVDTSATKKQEKKSKNQITQEDLNNIKRMADANSERIKAERRTSNVGKKYHNEMKLKLSEYVTRDNIVRSTSVKRAEQLRKPWDDSKRDPNWYQIKRAAEKTAREKARVEAREDRAATRAQERQDKLKAEREAREVAKKERRERTVHNRKVYERSRYAQKVEQNRVRRQVKAKARRAKEQKSLNQSVSRIRKSLKDTPRMAHDRIRNSKMSVRRQNQVWKSLTRAEKYPAMRHASKSPFPRTLPRSVGGGRIRAYQPVETMVRYGLAPHVSFVGEQMYSTRDTFVTDRFPLGDTGVVMHIDAFQVLDNLSRSFPEEITRVLVTMKPKVAKKLLDMIEPYVPKDTGFMYSSSEDLMGSSGLEIEGGSMYGVTIAYRAPYAEIVYYDESKAHGAAYNAKHGTSEKGELETARWIERAFADNERELNNIMDDYGKAIRNALKKAGWKQFVARGKPVGFFYGDSPFKAR